MKMHEKGVKAGRDRRHVLVEYDKLVKFFKLKPLEPTKLAAMTANQLYQLCEDTWNRQPTRRKLDYQEAASLSPRRKPLAFKWFVLDTLNIKQPKDLAERLIIYVQLPFRYPGFVRRKKARMKAERAEAEKKLQEAAKAGQADVERILQPGAIFTEEQKAKIQELKAMGDTVGAQRIILDEVSKTVPFKKPEVPKS